MNKITPALLLPVLLAGCISTKFVIDDKWNPSSKPSYVDNFEGWWWGLAESRHPAEVSLQKVCMDQKPMAVQRVKNAEDIIISVLALGIYLPTTVKVWCGE